MITITSKNYNDEVCVLVDQPTGRPLMIGQTVKTFRGEEVTIDGGKAPQKPSSEGKVFVHHSGNQFKNQYYAGVIGAEWILLDDLIVTPKGSEKWS